MLESSKTLKKIQFYFRPTFNEEKFFELEGLRGNKSSFYIPGYISSVIVEKYVVNGKVYGEFSFYLKNKNKNNRIILKSEFYQPLLEKLRTSGDFELSGRIAENGKEREEIFKRSENK